MRFKRILFISIVLIALTVGAVSAHDNSTLMSDDSADAQTAKTFADVQSIINSANENDTIELDGYYEGSGTPIKISKAITINGNNAVLDAKSQSKIIDVRLEDSANKVFLNGITFTNGHSTRNAGAINGGTLTDCSFKNCIADQRGGVATDSILNRCTITNCHAQRGGALYDSTANE